LLSVATLSLLIALGGNAQTCTVSNLQDTVIDKVNLNGNIFATKFATGTDASYSLTSATVALFCQTSGNFLSYAAVYLSESGLPGTLVSNLTFDAVSLGTASSSQATIDLSSPVSLSPSTTYFFAITAPSECDWSWTTTVATSPDGSTLLTDQAEFSTVNDKWSTYDPNWAFLLSLTFDCTAETSGTPSQSVSPSIPSTQKPSASRSKSKSESPSPSKKKKKSKSPSPSKSKKKKKGGRKGPGNW